MQRYGKIEIAVGAFVILGGIALAYLAFTLGGVSWNKSRYVVHARFASVGELKLGAPVKLAGVSVGEVTQLRLENFAAETELAIEASLKLPRDTIASIQSAGLLGDDYVSLSPGGAEQNLGAGARIAQTEPAVSLTELIAKYAFGSPLNDKPNAPAKPASKDLLE